MATLVNQTANQATLANQSISQSKTWDEATFTWDDSVPATWDNPQPVANQTANTTTLSNQTAL